MIFHDSGKQKSIKNRFKIDEKMLSKMEGLNFPSFCWKIKPNRLPGRTGRPQEAPRGAARPSKRPPGCPQDAARTLPKRLQDVPGTPQNAFRKPQDTTRTPL